MSTVKDELDALHKQQREIEGRIAALYAVSRALPDDQKVCPDFMADMLSEPQHGLAFPIDVHGIDHGEVNVFRPTRYTGKWVAVRPCSKELEGKTFLGIFLGDLALDVGAFYHRETGVLEVRQVMHNPAIWVPELNRIIFGCESWWGVLKSPDDLKQITDADIQNIWYVQALHALEAS